MRSGSVASFLVLSFGCSFMSRLCSARSPPGGPPELLETAYLLSLVVGHCTVEMILDICGPEVERDGRCASSRTCSNLEPSSYAMLDDGATASSTKARPRSLARSRQHRPMG